MSKLEKDFSELCGRFKHKGGAALTRINRERMLRECARDLGRAGFPVRSMMVSDFKGRHVNALLKYWNRQGLAVATVKNRLSALRWALKQAGNSGAIKSNEELHIANRVYATNKNKAHPLASKVAAGVERPPGMSDNVWLSIRLQANFGLRSEEGMKFQARFALAGKTVEDVERIHLKGSWCKGGRERWIPVRTAKQRELLREAMRLANHETGSLIPDGVTYKTQLARFKHETNVAGLGKTHGFRHWYAHERYKEMTGWDCRAVAGHDRAFTLEEKKLDILAREEVSKELGHGRLKISSNYLGKIGK
jgi:site-specific recombinase XerC